ncbi:MAG: intermembrane phospholipid transport protein YdbH family protein [Desulfobulbus sp.]|jgi:hypothetical protein
MPQAMRLIMRLIRPAALFLLIVAAGLAALLVFRTTWTGWLLPWLLEQAGLQQVELEIAHWKRDELAIAAFSAVLPGEAGQGATACTVQNLRLTHHLHGLLRGKLDRLSIERAELHLPPSQPSRRTATAPTPADPPGAGFRFTPEIPGTLPFRSLEIQELELVYGPESQRRRLVVTALADTAGTSAPRLRMAVLPGPAAPQAELLLEKNRLSARLKLDLAELAPLVSTGVRTPLRGSLEAVVEGTLSPSGTDLTLAPSSRLRLRRFATPGISLAAVDLGLKGRVHLDGKDWTLELQPSSAWEISGLHSGTLHLAPVRCTSPKLQLRLTPHAVHASWSFGLPQVAGRLHLACTTARTGAQEGQCTLRTPEALRLVDPARRPPLILKPALPLTLSGGQLSLNLLAQWRTAQPLALQGRISCAEGTGTIAGLPFSGLQLNQQLHLLPRLASTGPGNLRVARIGGPVPVANLDVRAAFRQQPSRNGNGFELRLHRAEARLLGGTASARDCLYTSSAATTTCPVQLDRLDLHELSALLLNNEDLHITGSVRGSLPLALESEGLRMRQGHLESMGGGQIRYTPAGKPDMESGLSATAFKALSDLRYRELTADLDYAPDGELVIAARIEGTAPQLDSHRPVQLNLNLSQNLLSLLKSLQYSQRLSSELDRQLNK